MTEDLKTEFNQNVATLKRINERLQQCAEAFYLQDLDAYCKSLSNLRREMRYKTRKNQKQREKVDNDYKAIDEQMNIAKSSGDPSVMKDLWDKCEDYENYLRDLMDEKGMLLTEQQGGQDSGPDF